MGPLHGRMDEVECQKCLLDDPLRHREREATVWLSLLQRCQSRSTRLLHNAEVRPDEYAKGALAILGSPHALLLPDLEEVDISQVGVVLHVGSQSLGKYGVERLQ